MKNFGMGARLLSAEEAKDADLGDLQQLVGKWVNAPIDPYFISQGWNVISVPGTGTGAKKDFVYEVIPYTETLTFSPVVIQAGNRGPLVNGKQVEQQIFGLMYEQQITSDCSTKFCTERGFSKGTPIHAETGMFLNVGNPNGGFDVARMATIPHGNALLAMGHGFKTQNPGNDFFPIASAVPTNLDGSLIQFLGYTDPVTRAAQFPGIFNQVDPNSFLKQALGNDVITEMTTLKMSTQTANAGGGILNIPFIETNVDTTSMDFIFWIETIKGKDSLQLQYTQTINLVFPPTGLAIPIMWPHITINTLVKVK